jgi:hypothetical protein
MRRSVRTPWQPFARTDVIASHPIPPSVSEKDGAEPRRLKFANGYHLSGVKLLEVDGGLPQPLSPSSVQTSEERTLKGEPMSDQEQRTVRLQVAGANERDVDKGTVRLGDDAFYRFGIEGGAIVEIMGPRSTAAIALPPFPEGR